MRLGATIAAGFLIFVSSPVFAVALWQDANGGMSEADIRAIYPRVIKPDNSRPYLPGAILELQLSNTEFADQSFNADFYFNDNGLVQVALVNRTLKKKRQIREACDAVKSALNSDYGSATSERIIKSIWGKQQYSIYEKGELRVNLTCEGRHMPLRIVFQTASFADQIAPFGLPIGLPVGRKNFIRVVRLPIGIHDAARQGSVTDDQ